MSRRSRRTGRGRHSGVVARLRARAYDVLALAARLGVGGVFAAHGAHHLLHAPESTGTLRTVVAVTEVAAGGALALGAAAILAGPALAVAAALRPLQPQGSTDIAGLGAEALPVAAVVCLLLAVNAGRLSADHLLLRALRPRPSLAPRVVHTGGMTKRPENAPPLPYSGVRHRPGERRGAG